MGIEDGVHNRNGCSLSNGFGLSPTKRKKKAFFFTCRRSKNKKENYRCGRKTWKGRPYLPSLRFELSEKGGRFFSRERARAYTRRREERRLDLQLYRTLPPKPDVSFNRSRLHIDLLFLEPHLLTYIAVFFI